MQCRNCGDPVDPGRVELGYDYCLKEECQQRCLKKVLLASVAVNKAADYYTKAEEVLPPPAMPPALAAIEADDTVAAPREKRRPTGERRSKTTLERLRHLEAALDRALAESYERFCRGEVTAKDMEIERERLIRAFNQVVSGENIRYRSMVRSRTTNAGHGHR